MSGKRHEIPTHLNVEDKAFYGLSVRQVMFLTIGFAGGYGLWNQWPDLALAVRAALALSCCALAAAIALVRPHGRGLEEWAFVALHYLAVPKASIWRVREPDLNAWQPLTPRWAELAPHVTWSPAEDQRDREAHR